ncbi:MAG: hypothetical protein JWN02_2684 [Acidobacteria bacterium]|nr:hypothetical protein [Acidobacteriota bacterium]
MKNNLATLLITGVCVVGCGRAKDMHRQQQNYSVVQEGNASGVTSTINAPGETAPPAATAPMTTTNVDTTTMTNFGAPNIGTGNGTLSSTLPAPDGNVGYPRTVPAAVATIHRTVNVPPATATGAATPPARLRRHDPSIQPGPPQVATPAPPESDTTAATDTVAPATDTTQTEPPPSKVKPPKDDQKDNPSPPPPTDTAPPPPPPPAN